MAIQTKTITLRDVLGEAVPLKAVETADGSGVYALATTAVISGDVIVDAVAIDQATPGDTNRVVSEQSGTVWIDDTEYTVKRGIISESASGQNNILAAVASKSIRVLSYNFVVADDVVVTFYSDGAGTPVAISGAKTFSANGGMVAPRNVDGWFQTGSGKTFDVNLSAAVLVGGEFTYIEV